jgi:hypothetical protein
MQLRAVDLHHHQDRANLAGSGSSIMEQAPSYEDPQSEMIPLERTLELEESLELFDTEMSAGAPREPSADSNEAPRAKRSLTKLYRRCRSWLF